MTVGKHESDNASEKGIVSFPDALLLSDSSDGSPRQQRRHSVDGGLALGVIAGVVQWQALR